jgi:predicted HNH restriction endonuclease
MVYCKSCFNKRCVIRWIKRKIEAINLKGGKCENCGLQLQDSHYSVFEFHHRNPIEKDNDWSKLRTMSWSKIQKELDKCALLCANCHRIVHSEGLLLNLDFTEFDNIQ